jgi:D-alanyl-D-alanine-carboxypeptidase/D-alanyl-D-alanine-endopeptidase
MRVKASAGGATNDLAGLAARYAPQRPAGLVMARLRGGVVEIASAGPVADDAVFELGSITKVVTGLLLADAVVRGEVTLETPLADCLPGARPGSRIALGDLAAHTGGLPKLPLAVIRRAGLTNLVNPIDPYADTTIAELVEDLASVRLRSPRMRYSNFGAALLGQALAARADAPYEQLVEERVLQPLGVEEVWARDTPPVAQPHDRRGRPVPAWTLGAYAPAGCLRGSARGALALSMACLHPPGPMADAVALALTPRVRRGQIECGLGWMRSPVIKPDRRIWWHGGATHGSRAFTGFRQQCGEAVAAVTNSPRPTDRGAWQALRH